MEDEQANYDLAEIQQMAQQGRRLAIYDRATGLYAYWYLELRADEELSRCARFHKRLALMSIWAVRPESIAEAGEQLRGGLRDYDLAAYLNNGHFVALLTETDGQGARVVLDRMRRALGRGFSAGIALFPEDGLTFDALLEVAKRRGEASERAA
jgi:GGDEF domain-containing protein